MTGTIYLFMPNLLHTDFVLTFMLKIKVNLFAVCHRQLHHEVDGNIFAIDALDLRGCAGRR